MILCNKRVDLPEEIVVGSNAIKVVKEFKLLGVTIDNKLTFKSFVANVRLNINKRLYSIKRLFYLSFSVKLQFFKSFILPIFDYCSSLCIYFPKYLIQKLNNSYYRCLNKLFRFKFFQLDNNTINDFLRTHHLFSYTHRVFYRLCLFIFNIVNNPDSPSCLKDQLVKTKKMYNLRTIEQDQWTTNTTNNHFGDNIFKNIFSKFLNTICSNIDLFNFNDFKKYIFCNFNEHFDKFVKKFEQFNVTCTLFYC